MPVRITPDNNDIVVWKLDDAAPPFINSSTSPSAPSHAVSDLATLSGTGSGAPKLQQPSPFSPTGAVLFTGTNSGSPRNFIAGANGVQPQAPVTFSCWVYLRNYSTTGFTQHLWAKQTNTGNWSSTFASVELQNRTYASQSQQWDLFVLATGATPLVPAEYTIPLNTWSHTGITWDGSTQLAYINGVLVGQVSSTGSINYGSTPGPWFFGAIPSGSGNPEECVASICDFRIANVVRSQTYFQNVFRAGATTQGSGLPLITYYKLRAYDLSCPMPTPVYWVSRTVNYTDAPAPPCGSVTNLGPIEIVESWKVLG